MNKRFYTLLLLAVLIALAPAAWAQYDDLYYDPDTDGTYYETQTQSDDYGDRYYEEEYYDDEYYDHEDYGYIYTSRIRRFHRPYYGFDYYSPVYIDPYYYGGYYPGMSIYYNDLWSYDRYYNWGRWNRHHHPFGHHYRPGWSFYFGIGTGYYDPFLVHGGYHHAYGMPYSTYYNYYNYGACPTYFAGGGYYGNYFYNNYYYNYFDNRNTSDHFGNDYYYGPRGHGTVQTSRTGRIKDDGNLRVPVGVLPSNPQDKHKEPRVPVYTNDNNGDRVNLNGLDRVPAGNNPVDKTKVTQGDGLDRIPSERSNLGNPSDRTVQRPDNRGLDRVPAAGEQRPDRPVDYTDGDPYIRNRFATDRTATRPDRTERQNPYVRPPQRGVDRVPTTGNRDRFSPTDRRDLNTNRSRYIRPETSDRNNNRPATRTDRTNRYERPRSTPPPSSYDRTRTRTQPSNSRPSYTPSRTPSRTPSTSPSRSSGSSKSSGVNRSGSSSKSSGSSSRSGRSKKN